MNAIRQAAPGARRILALGGSVRARRSSGSAGRGLGRGLCAKSAPGQEIDRRTAQ